MYIVLPEQWILFFVFSTLLLGSLFEPGNYANDRFSAAKKGENAVSGVECGDWRQGGKGREEKKFDKCSNVMEGRRKERG